MALPRLREGLGPFLRGVLRDVLASSERDASVELGHGLELLLGIDRVLCGGSGVVTTRIASSLASRVLSQSAGLVVAGDAVSTLQHLRAPFEHPFMDVTLDFLARRSPDGFTLELLIPHEPRAAGWLASAGLGYAKAATRFSGEGSARLRLYGEVTGSMARVLGRYTDSGVVALGAAAGSTSAAADGTRPARRRSAPTNAAERVDQILSRAPGRAGPASEPPPARGRGLHVSSTASWAPEAPSASGTRPSVASVSGRGERRGTSGGAAGAPLRRAARS